MVTSVKTNIWFIVDDEGIVYRGSKNSIFPIWERLIDGEPGLSPDEGWKGPIRLLQQHAVWPEEGRES